MATSPDDNRLGRAYAAPEVTVFYDRSRCRHYAECVRGLPQVFDPARLPGSTPTWPTPTPWPRWCAAAPPAPSTTACWQRNQRNRPIRPSSPLTPGGHCWSAAILSWTPPRGRWLRPAPRYAPAAAPGTSPSVTAHAVSTAAPLAAPETRRRHPRSVEPETWRLCISWTSRTARTARAASGSSGVKARAPAKSHLGGQEQPDRLKWILWVLDARIMRGPERDSAHQDEYRHRQLRVRDRPSVVQRARTDAIVARATRGDGLLGYGVISAGSR